MEYQWRNQSNGNREILYILKYILLLLTWDVKYDKCLTKIGVTGGKQVANNTYTSFSETQTIIALTSFCNSWIENPL